MQTVRQIAKEIVHREGGFVSDPDDPGGTTKFGVTIHTMRRFGLDLTGDGLVDEMDVRALTRREAVDIFVSTTLKNRVSRCCQRFCMLLSSICV